MKRNGHTYVARPVPTTDVAAVFAYLDQLLDEEYQTLEDQLDALEEYEQLCDKEEA